MPSAFNEGLMAEPGWLKAWVGWMVLVNSLALLFVMKREARVVLAVWVLNGISMTLMAEWTGYNRLLGIVHVIWWTPLMVYLYTQRDRIAFGSWYGRWVVVLMATNCTSLVVDYIDVVRYALGDRS